ncbi:MAG: hypothetical protein ABJC10_08665 [Acidobacteriota bacterium]
MLFVIAPIAAAQSPFVTDDTDTTPKGHFHFGFIDEFDLLQRASLPSTKQNAASFELEYGLLDNLEIGVEAPLLTIFNERGTDPLRPGGIGDTNFSVKYNFLKEREHSLLPALTIVANLEFPTGNIDKGLGSGLTDFYMNGILQKTVTRNTTFRLNGGILFSGNQTTGAEGFRTRGTVFTGGGSLVKQFTPKVLFGVELTGASTGNFDLGAALFQTTIGGNYQFRKNATIDFGVVAGKHEAAPRFGAVLGISIDF